MGTRAMISWKGEPMVTTHWDGHPESLGKKLLGSQDLYEVIIKAKEFSINSVSKKVMKVLNKPLEWFGEHADISNPANQTDTEFSYDYDNGKWSVSEPVDRFGVNRHWGKSRSLSREVLAKQQEVNMVLDKIRAENMRVKTHTRKTKSGKIVTVSEHMRKRK